MRLPIAPFAMRRPIQNALANQSGCKLPSSKQNSVLWTRDWLRYGALPVLYDRTAADYLVEIG